MKLRSALAVAVAIVLVPSPVWAAVGPADGAPATAEPPAPTDEDKAPASPSMEDGPSQADPMIDSLIEEAARHFKEGRRLFFDGDYAAAAAEFERSYAAIRSGDALRNVVLSHSRAGAPIPAIRAARRYLQLPACGSPDVDPKRPLDCSSNRDEVEQTLERLMRQVGELRLVIEPGVEVVEVRVSGRVVPQEDFPIVLEPGEVDVEVVGAGSDERLLKLVRLRAGKQSAMYVPTFGQPVDDDGDAKVDPNPPDDRQAERERLERRRRATRTAFWAGLGVTVASGVALGVLGGLTVNAKDEFEADQDDTSDGMGPPEDVADRFYNLRRGTNAMIAVTAVLGMTTLVLGLFAFSPSRDNGRRASTRKRLRITPGGVMMRF